MSLTYTYRLERILHKIEADSSVAELPAGERQTLGALWTHRSRAELLAATTFRRIHDELHEDAAADNVLSLAAQAIEDERFHSELCARVAAHYLGTTPEIVPFEDSLTFASCDPRTARALRVALHAAINETIAAAYLRECLAESRSDLVRGALRELLKDEVQHARIGWAHLASPCIPNVVRAAIVRELPGLIQLSLQAWNKPLTLDFYPRGHGALDADSTRRISEEAVTGLVVPGLRQLGYWE